MKYLSLFRSLYLSLLILWVLTGCGGSKKAADNPLTRRYARVDTAIEMSEQNSVIDVVSMVIPSETLDTAKAAARTIFDLKGGGKKAMIDAFDKKDDDAGQGRLNDLLNAEYQVDAKTTAAGLLKKNYAVVFSAFLSDFYGVIKKTLSAGDRIEKLKLTATVPDADKEMMKFMKWDKFVTQFAQFDIGGASFSVAKQATLSPSIPIGVSSLSVGSLSKGTTYTEGDSLTQRFVLLNGILHSDYFELDQTGTPEIDLQGNTSVSVTVYFPNPTPVELTSFKGLENKDGAWQTADKVSVKLAGILIPRILHDVNLNLRIDYILRHIDTGDKTFMEGDDHISYYWGHFTRTIAPFVRVEEVLPKVWSVRDGANFMGLYDEKTKEHYELGFSSFEEADAFLEWVNRIVPNATAPITIGRFKLLHSYQQGAPAQMTYLDKTNYGSFKVTLSPRNTVN
jgi:hypothetical protein